MLDGFLQLYTDDGALVEGECTDAAFTKSIEIASLTLGNPGKDEDEAEDEDAKKKAADNAKGKEKLAARFPAKQEAGYRSFAARVKNKNGSSSDSSSTKGTDDTTDKKKKKKSEEKLSFTITKDIDAASADLFQAFCRKKSLKPPPAGSAEDKIGKFSTATVTLRKLFQGIAQPFLVVKFAHVVLASYKVSYDDSGEPTETVEFVFEDYDIEYIAQTATGGRGRGTHREGTVARNTAAGN